MDEVTGIAVRSARELIAEIGVTMTDQQSAGRKKAGSTGKGNPWLAALWARSSSRCPAPTPSSASATAASVRRRGKKRALVAVGKSVLTIIWHLLSDPDARYHDLGADYYESKINKQRRRRDLIHQLEHLTGQKVTLTPAA